MSPAQVGLDFSPHVLAGDESQKDAQRAAFSAQVSLASELGLPLNVHSRSAGHHAIDLLLVGARTAGGDWGLELCRRKSLGWEAHTDSGRLTLPPRPFPRRARSSRGCCSTPLTAAPCMRSGKPGDGHPGGLL
jgi:hypothetical protein